ncbi:hypothetical protein BC936DRAFT_137760 [Jimgerdemannia flammicorona]|uniref:Uncharacterized protein n=1 Tax=Jimgerdemannia flammicorona TaxID=994334 RepID=A0A433CWR5_9FUNG|nr:hypothetical protein BC936DRAFT_137760 [Jimgerdemannia flammicorona]
MQPASFGIDQSLYISHFLLQFTPYFLRRTSPGNPRFDQPACDNNPLSSIGFSFSFALLSSIIISTGARLPDKDCAGRISTHCGLKNVPNPAESRRPPLPRPRACAPGSIERYTGAYRAH